MLILVISIHDELLHAERVLRAGARAPRCDLGKGPIVGAEERVKNRVAMQFHLSFREAPSGNQGPPTPFKVLIMYEDFGTGKRAKKGLDYVAEELGNDFEFRHSMWRLDILQDPKLNILAAPALAEADLLIISLRGEGQIPAKIRVLIDTWLAEKANRDCALVALFEAAASATRSSVYACLANLARQHGLDFLEQAVSEPEDQEEPSLKLVWVF